MSILTLPRVRYSQMWFHILYAVFVNTVIHLVHYTICRDGQTRDSVQQSITRRKCKMTQWRKLEDPHCLARMTALENFATNHLHCNTWNKQGYYYIHIHSVWEKAVTDKFIQKFCYEKLMHSYCVTLLLRCNDFRRGGLLWAAINKQSVPAACRKLQTIQGLSIIWTAVRQYNTSEKGISPDKRTVLKIKLLCYVTADTADKRGIQWESYWSLASYLASIFLWLYLLERRLCAFQASRDPLL